MNGPRVLALTGDETGPTLWRVWQPYTELQRRGYGAWFRHKDDPEIEAPEWPYLAATRLEAIVIPRFYWRDHAVSRSWVATLHKHELAVIYDLDDDVLSPQIGARQQATTEKFRSLEELEQDRRDRIAAIRLCDGITTSNEHLARVIRQYAAAPVVVVPNQADDGWFRRVMHGSARTVAPLTIGWAGGSRYDEDLEPIAAAWHNIARRYPHVRFVIMGYRCPLLTEAVPPEQLHVVPWMSVVEYPRGLKNIDIGCAGVANNHFNRCKTPIKVWEMTMAGAACVVSPTLYGEVVTDGQDGLIADTALEWEAQLSRLLDDPALRRQVQHNQRRRVARDHSLRHHVLDWPRAWTTILEHFRSQQLAA